MNANAIAKNYALLTAEERFRLMYAARERGDEAEWERLATVGKRITLSVLDFAPYIDAFQELALLVLIDLLDQASRYTEDRALFGKEEQEEDDLVEAVRYILHTKVQAWKLFCERLSVPPFSLWEGFPVYVRLQGALALAEKSSMTPEGFLRWANAHRPAEAPELSAPPLTVEGLAEATERLFRQSVKWWGG